MPSYTDEQAREIITRFHRLRDEGVSYRDAADRLSISTATAQKWTKRFGMEGKQDLERRVNQMDRRLRVLEDRLKALNV